MGLVSAVVCFAAVASGFAPPGRSLRRSTVVKAVDIQFGETGGAALIVEDVSVRRGPVELLTGVNWRVMPGERWGIVGPNGAGKSTLLGAILGVFNTASGKVSVLKGAQVGYLEQTGVGGSDSTVRSEVMSRMGALSEAQEMVTKATAVVEGGDYGEEALEALGEAQAAFEEAGGYSSEERLAKVLGGLGFDVSRDLDRPCSDFSGGWQMRIALARLLLSEPDLLLLDEPTNHLDAAARSWLAGYLAEYAGTLILVSHDTAMLKVVCDSIAEVVGEQPRADKPLAIGRQLETYKSCSFSKWRAERVERASRWVNKYEKQLTEKADLEDFIRKFGAKASKASQAKDRERKLDRLSKEMLPKPPEEIMALAATVEDERERLKRSQRDASASVLEELVVKESGSPLLSARGGARLKLPEAPPGGEELLRLEGTDLGYNSQIIVKDVDDLIIRGGMRVIVRGPNGAGKSTLVKTLAGAIPPLKGKVHSDARLKLGHFTQDLSQELDQTKTALELVLDSARSQADEMTPEAKARAVLGALGLRGEMALRTVGTLSGGEKARVALAIFVLTPCNLYILDEPSNHLDVDTVVALAKALNDYDGAIVVVSHDRAFVDGLKPTHVLTVQDGTALLEKRALTDRDWHVESVALNTIVTEEEEDDSRIDHASQVEEEDPEVRRKRHNKPKLMEKLETKISKTEAKISKLDSDLSENGSDPSKSLELLAIRDPLKVTLDDLYKEYESLEAL